MNKKLLYLLLGLNCLACAWTLAVRCSSNLNAGAFCSTNGYESLMAYSIWKIQNHLPLYEWPQREPFALTLYNYLFYELYAHLLKCLGGSGVGILLAGRMLTLLFACVGAGVLTSIMRKACPEQTCKGTMPLTVMLASLTWLSTSFLAWHALSLRPDVAAVATACIGTLIFIHAVNKHSKTLVALSGLLFYGCWAQKQSTVTLFLGACLFLLISRQFKLLVLLASSFAISVLMTLWVSGDEYRYNILVAPRIVGSFSLKCPGAEAGNRASALRSCSPSIFVACLSLVTDSISIAVRIGFLWTWPANRAVRDEFSGRTQAGQDTLACAVGLNRTIGGAK